MTRGIESLAQEYFHCLGSNLPHQCASDEFYFLPRSEEAPKHLGTLDDLDPDRLRQLIVQVQAFVTRLEREHPDALEDEIDLITLKKSMERFLWEYGSMRVWRTDPMLYIKIPLFAIAEIMSGVRESVDETREELRNLLSQIPRFLQRGRNNLRDPSRMSVVVASEMVRDAIDFFQRDVPLFIRECVADDTELLAANEHVLTEWLDFKTGLQSLDVKDRFSVGNAGLATILDTGLGYSKSPEQVAAMAQCAYHDTLAQMKHLAKTVDPCKPWQTLIMGEAPHERFARPVLDLYRHEVEKLRAFFSANEVITFPSPERVEVQPTPSYLQSLRATASYKAPLTGVPDRTGVFYITPEASTSPLVRSHLPYLSAHETYPGHHVLDMVRLHNPNPVRRQIEAPLFYEGWACYAETLLDELGYVSDPRLRLVQLHRQLWRDLRAILDVKLQTGGITHEAAVEEIRRIGFPASVAERQVRRFALTPGYQSCYFLGMHEIVRLRDRFAPRIGLKHFHDTLLRGGQIGFDLVEKRLEAVIHTTSPFNK